ncbi:protein tramtrack, alpha isoform isoform X1 [Ceratina calcarata]|uniref:Protein tramtrack, alpha isoform isoform X1 n=1 Tax=Ceratina calcarata TaxID=156304 RepID=A0AAJ7S7F6_9HYME|nr:protein tramtrack, alpha isoform isoform X1 [Ceratina calcarata]XP_026672866.1 protein tramtrack, alpha isoform isoform X1 [Ceratina calcarata]XP_026672867.1 protein tramtrack, alpha isoform isoform X1 [Ceratina calcarata]XP_026672868.1 protein tramtrack, alpha isoform isoform X1 [Ceratina calcarata]XP_026672869.1 protein tramtrack, alpha isoform isoform X1 [Ceratina calcarata]XP_026672870.1 protein tramtrack, alpha isoform isoform X1 [Ceratina calcarata]XP_026672871.1 protein tramtrack, a
MLADINGNLADLRSEAMASQRFCLRWNNHQSNLLSVFDQLLHDESFVDVTLAVEGQLLRAHKMVLSACSPYFQALFVGHPDRHPIVILKDVPYVDMRSLLDFMYRGEVSVDQDRLTAFLRVAESLRIKGLTEVNEDKCDLPSITSSLLGNQNTVPPPPPNLHRINQIGPHHHVSQKRMHHMSSHPLLGSALSAPKRKRGRPRKLSGSSDTPIGEISGQELQSCSGADLVQGSPEMMEMKMSIDFQSESNTGNSGRSGSTGNANSNNVSSNNVGNSASTGTALSSSRKDEPTENGTDTPESLTPRVKREPEPTPSTSAQASDETFARPHSRQGSEGFKQDQLPSLPSDITFEICTSSSSSSPPPPSSAPSAATTRIDEETFNEGNQDGNDAYIKSERVVSGMHFLTDREEDRGDLLLPKSESGETEPEVKKQLLEYLIQNDGSVVCKWCGEVLPSRTRWYRHKYKLHVSTQVTQPAPLFKCHSCNAYFKSRKGYIGHLSSRHSDNENDENREETANKRARKTSDIGKGPDWEQQREKEEKLVADIIDRVKRECEAQGETVTRRGYSRRSTVMNS